MDDAPYYVHVKARPQRVAFLVRDTSETLGIVDAILAHNRERWGGRYNPIVITDGETLTPAWWSWWEVVDPDIVRSFVPLADALVSEI